VHYPTIEYTSRVLGIPVRTLQRRFRERDLSYSQLVDQVRLELACSLVEQRDLRLEDIAETLGYANPSAFSRAFRRWFGMSPRDYRRLG